MDIGITDSLLKPEEEKFGRDKYKKMHEFGFSTLDFQLMDTDDVWYQLDDEQLKKKAAETRAWMEDGGMRVSQAHGPWTWPPTKDTTPEGRILRAAEMKKSMYITHLLGGENWVMHPIMPFGKEDIPLGRQQETWELNVAFLSELAVYAGEIGVTLCVENMPMHDFSIATPADILRLLRAVDHPNCKACLDTDHVAVYPDWTAADAVRLLGGELRAMHAHDNNGLQDYHDYPGRGITDWTAYAKALHESGYAGVFSLEAAPSRRLPDEEYEREMRRLASEVKAIITSGKSE